MLRREIRIVVIGKDDGDIEMALEQAIDQIQNEGFTSGFNSNDSGSYAFQAADAEPTHNKLARIPAESADEYRAALQALINDIEGSFGVVPDGFKDSFESASALLSSSSPALG